MKRKSLIAVAIMLFTISTSCSAQENQSNENGSINDLGAMAPQKALDYMKMTKNLVIVDVASITNFNRIHFEGAVNIPIENINSDEARKLYTELPAGRPILLHCRQGVIVPGAYRILKSLRTDIPEISYITGAPLFDEYNDWKQKNEEGVGEIEGDKLLGGLTPKDALEYMTKTKNLIVIDVREPQWLGSIWFTDALLIPHTQMATRYSEIPDNRPVILNCGAGVNAPKAYRILKNKRPDIPQLSYIAGSPLFREYNEWYESNK